MIGRHDMFQVELVWNREFDFVPYGEPYTDLDEAIKRARVLENMGDGASVKKTRIVTNDYEVVWQYGKKMEKANASTQS
jgi:hypothetical protein